MSSQANSASAAATVIVVDDDGNITTMLRKVLETAGYTVVTAADGGEAISIMQGTRFDVVLTDVFMPRRGGLEVLRAAKAADPQCEVILMTSFAAIDMAVASMKLGAFDYFGKPFNSEEPLAKIRAALASRAQKKRISEREAQLRTHWEQARSADNPIDRARALEVTCELLFSSIPGFVTRTNVANGAEEVDVIVRNESLDPFWARFSAVFMVECKNWVHRTPGRADLDVFIRKLGRRPSLCNLGFFVSVGGVSTHLIDEAAAASREGRIVVVLDRHALDKLVAASDRNEYLKGLVENAAL